MKSQGKNRSNAKPVYRVLVPSEIVSETLPELDPHHRKLKSFLGREMGPSSDWLAEYNTIRTLCIAEFQTLELNERLRELRSSLAAVSFGCAYGPEFLLITCAYSSQIDRLLGEPDA